MALDLSGKIFGLPVPVVGGVIGLGLVALLYFRSSSQAAASAAPQTVAVPDVGPGDQVDSRGTQDGGNGAQEEVFTSNGTWTAKALAWIVSTQGKSPLTVQSAISKYLTGEALTTEEGDIVNTIIGQYGLPPQGVTGISTITPKKLTSLDPKLESNEVTPVGTVGFVKTAAPFLIAQGALTTPNNVIEHKTVTGVDSSGNATNITVVSGQDIATYDPYEWQKKSAGNVLKAR